MGRSVSPLLRRELANLDNASSRQSAMKALKSYVRDLDSKAIPRFLAEVSESKEPGSSPAECTISLYEVLARVHGRKIVPQIDNIMSTIMHTLSSSAGSFPLHQACSRVVPAIARYAIDPSTPGDEKTRIIGSLYKPLCDALMGSQQSVASGAALCLKAVVEADNWRFASDDMVNEVCLKVAGALEEKETRTNYHMGLVMALAKHNSLTAEAYARSFLRSGLHILTSGVGEGNSQKRLSAIQMINSLMKYVDSRSISSEFVNVIDAMEKCKADTLQFVRVAAWETLQAAKALAAQTGSKQDCFVSPRMESNSHRRIVKISDGAADNEGAGENDFPAAFPSPESQTVDSFVGYDTFADSPMSSGQSSTNLEYARHTSRRLWANDYGGVDVSLKDGLFHGTSSECDYSEVDFEQHKNGELSDTPNEHTEVFSGFVQASIPSEATRSTTPSPQRSRTQLTIDDIKIYSTPRKLIRSLQEPINSNPRGSVHKSPNSGEVEQNTVVSPHGTNHSRYLNNEVQERRYTENMRMLAIEENSVQDSKCILDSTESVSSSGDVPSNCTCQMLCRDCDDMIGVPAKSTRRIKYIKATLGLGLALVILSVILSTMRIDNEDIYLGVVPT